MHFFRQRSDIALIELEQAVDSKHVIALYTNTDEKNREVKIYGKGASRNGIEGEQPESKQLKILRQCKNIITSAQDQWLSYVFDPPESAIKLEVMHGSGDSGGAAVIEINETPYLVGLSSWQYWHGPLSEFKGGRYGTTAVQVRISHYVDWINAVTQKH